MDKFHKCSGGWVWQILTKEEALEAFNDGKEVCLMYDDESESMIEEIERIQNWKEGDTTLVTPATAIYVTDITIQDPETKNDIDMCVYKDRVSGAMFAIDASWPEDRIASPFEPETLTHIYLGND